MRPVLYLAPKEPRCVPTACTKGQPCAREAIPQAPGRPQADFSSAGGTWVAECWSGNAWVRFVPFSAAVKPAEPKQPREWIGGKA